MKNSYIEFRDIKNRDFTERAEHISLKIEKADSSSSYYFEVIITKGGAFDSVYVDPETYYRVKKLLTSED